MKALEAVQVLEHVDEGWQVGRGNPFGVGVGLLGRDVVEPGLPQDEVAAVVEFLGSLAEPQEFWGAWLEVALNL